MVKAHECKGVYMQGKNYPGLSREEVLEIVPELVIDGDQPINDKGWYLQEHLETHEEMLLRVKEVVRLLKEQHRQTPDNTLLLISHCGFLEYLFALLTNQQPLLQSNDFSACNNSVTIVDLLNVSTQKSEFVEARLAAYNLQLLENTRTEFE